MSALTLAGMALGVAALLALALAAPLLPRRLASGAGIALCGAGAMAALAWLAAGIPGARLVLPFPVAGLPVGLVLDGVSAFFLLAVLPIGAAALVSPAIPLRWLLLLLAAVMLGLLAADARTLVLGLAAAATAAIVLAHPPPTVEVPAGPSPANVLTTAVLAPLALYVLVRVPFDLAEPPQAGWWPAWWALALLVPGVAAAALGSLRAALALEIAAILRAAALAQAGLVTIGLGLALAARAVDHGPAGSLAMGGALFGVLAFGWLQALLGLAGSAVLHGAGTQHLDRLGGLIHRMPITTAAVLVGGLMLAALPPGAGFAAAWMLLQSAMLLPRGDGLDGWALGALAAAGVALAMALLSLAAVRLIGVGFLGRPRSPRAAAADEVAPAQRWAMLMLCAALLPICLFPGLVLSLATPAIRLLTGTGVAGQAGALAVAPGPLLPGYGAAGLALLLVLAGALVALVVRLHSPPDHRAAPAWEGGQGPAPAWLPFGDPATQVGASGFSQPVDHLRGALQLGLARLRRWRSRLERWVAAWRRAFPSLGWAAPAAVLLALLLALAAGLW